MLPLSLLTSLSNNLASWPLLLPEGILATTLALLLVPGSFIPQRYRSWLPFITLVSLALAGFSKYRLSTRLASPTFLFNHLLILDLPGIFFSLLLIGMTVLWVLWEPPQPLPASRPASPTAGVLVLGVLLGSCLLVMAFHWLPLYLGVTLISLASALMIGSQATPLSAAAGLKYLLYSMVATALMLWGMGYWYGYTGTLAWAYPAAELRMAAWSGVIVPPVLLLCLSSLLFLLAVAPYHFWLPDVYQGARPATVAYLSTVPKLAALAALWRISQQFLPQLGPVYYTQVQQGLAGLALLTLVIGHTAALLQNNLQRILAYGAIAQGGLLIAGVAALPDSQTGLLYYSVLYAVMNLAAWWSSETLQHLAGSSSLQGLAGLGRQFPVLGVSVTIIMLALVGLPPTAGFTGKLLLLTGLWEATQHTGSLRYGALLLTSLVGTVCSLYYYLRLPYVLFAQPVTQASPPPGSVPRRATMLLGLLALLLLAAFGAGSRLLP